jgi:hypothetical protein
MTAAWQSALNVRGLDTVVIDDTRFTNVIENGRNVLTRLHLGSNEILQMAGESTVVSRRARLHSFRPPDRLLEPAPHRARVSTRRRFGARRSHLRRPGRARRRTRFARPARPHFLSPRSTRFAGTRHHHAKRAAFHLRQTIEALPVDRAWAELIVNAEDDMVPYLAVMSSIESLHRMTREENDIDDMVVQGSDHLTSYNLYAKPIRGWLHRRGYGMPRHLFNAEAIAEWAEQRGVLVKSVEDAALAMASCFAAWACRCQRECP